MWESGGTGKDPGSALRQLIVASQREPHTTRRGHELTRVGGLVFCCRLSGHSLDEAQDEVQCGACKRVVDCLRGRGGRSDVRVHHPWRQCAGWEIDDGVDVVDGVVGAVGHRERDTAEVDDRSVG